MNMQLSERLANARLVRADIYHQYVNEDLKSPASTGPSRDEKGRTLQDQYHYWCGVVDTYEYLISLEG